MQQPGFFAEFARFYCTGEFPGFDVRSVGRSAALLKWLSPQIVYATKEREYIRTWLAHLSSEDLGYDAAKLEMPIAWQAWSLNSNSGKRSSSFWYFVIAASNRFSSSG